MRAQPTTRTPRRRVNHSGNARREQVTVSSEARLGLNTNRTSALAIAPDTSARLPVVGARGSEWKCSEMDRPLIIRPALRSDLPQLPALYPHLDPADRLPPLDVAERRFEELRKYNGSAILVGLAGDAVVSSCTLVVIPNLTRGGRPYGLIENVVTHAAFRGRGFGKQLLHAAVTAAWQVDCYKVILMTGSKKQSTLAFYTSAGSSKDRFPDSAPCATRRGA
jgi:GNAT superfamily N-acetyltransferase